MAFRQARVVPRGKTPSQIIRLGTPTYTFGDSYHFLLTTSWLRLILIIIGLYSSVNLLFAGLYLAGGDCIENARHGSFVDAYFFSVQTMATIGYGKMVPLTVFANVLVTIEAITGLLFLAMATGLLFAKFSRPSARVIFSDVAVVGIRDGQRTLMFRLANTRGNQIVEATIRVVLARNERTLEGESVRRFHSMVLSRDSILFFALSWTVMHPIVEGSPLYGATSESLAAQGAEIIISLTGLDETFSQTVHARHSYIGDEIRWDARFVDILSRTPEGMLTVDYSRFHGILPEASAKAKAEK